ncbi:TolC family protein [Salinimicrobium sp. TH3]|uniref:TolC family protein n=1 Tax=Salinimicrobium sp. TH3 TaxID=2997342 RepID=UPI0022723BFE|nr:TolC family protein [Salinimicrobium sp. TH3]MCY2687633.1 TolC family protein [Salinimicrobium sp. TH3]
MKKVSFLILLLISSLTSAQEILTLGECYDLAEENYPLASQLSLLQEKTARELEVIQKDYLPKIDLNAKATYQSDVIEIPMDFGGQTIESVDKDQYRATVDVEQLIFNGGKITARKDIKEAELRSQQQEVKVNLYQIKKRINQYYFGILQLREQMALLESKKEALSERIQELESQVKYGTALPASENVLYAERLKIEQQQDEVESQYKSALQSLSAYIAKPLDTSTTLELPKQERYLAADGARPESLLYNLKQEELDQQQSLLSRSLYPNIYGFAQGGYGRPGYNMLNNSFEDFYMVGVKLNWNVFDWGKVKEQKKSLEISKDLIESERETFNFNNRIELEEAQMKINKIQKLLKKDREIIALRESIVETTQSQLTHGVITPSEFLTEFNNLYEAKINQRLHEIDLEKAKADYKIIKGNTEK